MASNINKDLLLYLIIAVPLVVVATMLFFIIKSVIEAVKTGKYLKIKMIVLSVVMIVIAAASYITNIGWVRLILFFLMVPFIHTIIFFITNLLAASFITNSKKLRVLSIIFNITYLIFYLLLPDVDDVRLYVFFRLIHNNAIISVCGYLSSLAFITQIVTFIMQMIEITRVKKDYSFSHSPVRK